MTAALLPERSITVTERQPRERAVPCAVCRRSTWNVSALCDLHEEEEAEVCPDCNERPCHPECLSGGGLT